MIERILCAILGHKYRVEIEFGTSRKVGCHRCEKKWGMHDATKSFVEWDGTFDEFYRSQGKIT